MLIEAIAVALLGYGVWNWGYWRGRCAKAKPPRTVIHVVPREAVPIAPPVSKHTHGHGCSCPRCRPHMYRDGSYAVQSVQVVEIRHGGMSQPTLYEVVNGHMIQIGPVQPVLWRCLYCSQTNPPAEEFCIYCGVMKGMRGINGYHE